VQREWAFDVDSVSRRTRLGLGSCGGMRCAARCGAVVAQLTDQSPEQGRSMAAAFLRRAAKHRVASIKGEQLRQEALVLAHVEHGLRGEESR
jgi:glycerol-3-phosphate dehydrogenase